MYSHRTRFNKLNQAEFNLVNLIRARRWMEWWHVLASATISAKWTIGHEFNRLIDDYAKFVKIGPTSKRIVEAAHDMLTHEAMVVLEGWHYREYDGVADPSARRVLHMVHKLVYPLNQELKRHVDSGNPATLQIDQMIRDTDVILEAIREIHQR